MVHNGIRIYELDNPTMEKKGKVPCRKVQVCTLLWTSDFLKLEGFQINIYN